MRVAFCHYTSDVCGGSDRALVDLVTHLDRERFTPFMLLKTGDPMASAYRDLGIEVSELPFVSPRRALEWRKLAAFFGWFWPHVFQSVLQFRRWKVDLVHVNTSNNLQGAVAARLARRPLVWHVRELVPDSRAGALMRAMVPLLATRAVAISNAVAASLSACGPRLRTVFDGLDLSAYIASPPRGALRAEFNIPPAAPVVVCIGRLEPWKGQDILIEAVPRMLAQRSDLRVLVVGGAAVNKPAFEKSLHARCRELAIEHAVTFTGIRQDVPELLAGADLLVLPSVSPEPFGLTVVEAMASARPVVATAAGGPLDTVEQGVTGLLVPANDPVSLAAAVLEIISDPRKAAPMGEAGRTRALERFSIERLVSEMSAVFDELCLVTGDGAANRPPV